VLEVEPKEEKSSKPLVCENHFSQKDIDSLTGFLKARAVPKISTVNRKKIPNERSKKVESSMKKRRIEMKIKEEPYEEVCFEYEKIGEHIVKDEPLDSSDMTGEVAQHTNDDSSDTEFIKSLLVDVRHMSDRQKSFFKSEMMHLIINSS
jgi:hypothetical protein